jgi:hypothetical protein
VNRGKKKGRPPSLSEPGVDALDASVDELNTLADLLARAALGAAGFDQHRRGEGRKRRG